MRRFNTRGLKEFAKERSLASGTGGGARRGRDRSDAFPYPTRPQWVALRMVHQAPALAPTGVAGVGHSSKRTAKSLERRGWIVWVHPEGARFPGWKLTATGVVALHSGELRFGAMPGSRSLTDTASCTCGHSPEEHGRDPKFPGSTACTICRACISYEADHP